MGLFDSVIKFSIKKNLGKWAKGAGTAAVSIASPYLMKYAGVELTPEQSAAASVAVASAIVGIANALKAQFPEQFGWL